VTAREKQREYERRYREANPDKVREAQRRYEKANRGKRQEYRREWRLANRERLRAVARANREVVEARRRRWREANPGAQRAAEQAWRERNREKERARLRTYAKANPEQAEIRNQRRRALKASVPTERWSRREILERDRWHCQVDTCLCPDGRAIDPTLSGRTKWGASVDHIKPLTAGGSDVKGNLQAAHMECNRAKGTRQ
jgi:hypothetical protein